MQKTRTAAAAALAAACTMTIAGASGLQADAAGIRATYLASSYALRKVPTNVVPNEVRPPDDTFIHAIARADFNGDGRVDLFFAPGRFLEHDRTPLELWLDTGSGFVDATEDILVVPSPGMQHPRKAVVGDFNGDDWPDAFFIGHGYDAPPFPGEYNQLFLSNGDGTLSYDDQFAGMVAFSHGGSAADVDGNGTLDIVVVGWQNYVLLNDGTARFTRRDIDLGDDGGFFTAELVDVDSDGLVDLFAAGHEFEGARTAIYWGDGTGGFDASDRKVLPRVEAFGIVVDVAADDLNGDGRRDIVAIRTGDTPFYEGRQFQVLFQGEDRSFRDESAKRISIDTTLPWIDWVRVQDIDADGAPDLLVASDRPGGGPIAWRNSGRGSFVAHEGGVVPQVRRWRSWPGDFDGDGRDDVLWRNMVTGESMGWPGADASQAIPLPPLPMDWDVAGIGDFDGDGTDDLLARNILTGENRAWSAVDEDAMPVVGALDDLDWDAAGVGDFDGDRHADILWRHAVSGANMVWPRGDAAGSEPLSRVDLAWSVAGVGDFNGDGDDDLLWRNATTGANQIWHSASAGDRRTVGTVRDAWWRVVHVADFDADGVDDILWRHARRGINRYWRGGYAREVQPFARVANPIQELAGVGDYDGDGRPDLMWRHLESGALQIWLKGNPKARMKVDPPGDVAWRPAS